MSNLLKSGLVAFQEEKKRIINSNEIVAKRLEELNIKVSSLRAESMEDGEPAEGHELDEAAREALFGEASGAIYQEKPVYDGPTPEEMIEEAKREIEEMKASAMQEMEQLKAQTLDQAMQQGYEDGYAKGQETARVEMAAAAKENEEMQRMMQEDFENRLLKLEPVMIEELTDIYDHVFAAGLKEQKGILLHLLDTTLHQIESGKEFIIRVSREDYEYVSSHRTELLEGMGAVTLDVVQDALMKQGDGMIETGGGIFDCSIFMELKELKNRLRTLAYTKQT